MAAQLAAARDRDGREGELDAVGGEGLLDHAIGAAPDHELLARLGHHLETDLDREITQLLDPLHLERLDDVRRELRVRLQLLADLLDDPLRLVEIGIVGDADAQLVDHPVTAHVLHRAEFPEWHRVEIAAVVPELDRAQRERFDGPFVAAADDVLADPEGVVEQVEHARDDVLDQGLRAEADRHPDHASTSDQGPDLHAERGERHQHGHGHQDDEEHVAQDRQERAQPPPAACVLAVGHARLARLDQPAVDPGGQEVPGEVGHQHVDHLLGAPPLDHQPGGVAAPPVLDRAVEVGVRHRLGSPAGLQAAVPDEAAAGDGEDPPPETGLVALEALEAAGHGEPDLGGQVVGHGRILGAQVAQQPGLVRPEHTAERGRRTRARGEPACRSTFRSASWVTR